MKRKVGIRSAAICAVFSALTVVLLFFGTLLDIIDITVAAASSLITVIVLRETGKRYSLLMFLASSVLAFLFMSSSSAVIYYISFFGYYPIVKEYINKLSKFFSTLLSYTVFNIIMLIDYLLFKSIFGISDEPLWMYLVLLIVSNIFFSAYNYALPVFSLLYEKKFRKIFRF